MPKNIELISKISRNSTNWKKGTIHHRRIKLINKGLSRQQKENTKKLLPLKTQTNSFF